MYQAKGRQWIIVAATAALLGTAGSAGAANLVASSNLPLLDFDDTSQADGVEWRVFGSDEIFAIQSLVAGTTGLNFDPTGRAAALGFGANPVGGFSLALGLSAESSGAYSVALGVNSNSLGRDSSALGRDSSAVGAAASAIGVSAVAEGLQSLSLGYGAEVYAERASALGWNSSATGAESLAAGRNASSEAPSSSAVGRGATARGENASAIGTFALAQVQSSLAVGQAAKAYGINSSALGYLARTDGGDSLAVGVGARAFVTNSTALGWYAAAQGVGSTAIGSLAIASTPGTIVLGSTAGENGATGYADVGMGTPSPTASLHVHRGDGSAEIFVEETSAVAGPRTLMKLANPGNTKFELVNTQVNESWAFTNSGIDFRVSRQGSGEVEFRVDNNGDAYVAGLLFENSDRNAKTHIVPVDPAVILDKVTQLPVAHWAYKETPDSFHIGPMAQDFYAAFGTGNTDDRLATMDVGGVAIASVQALNKKLEEENAALSEELSELRAAVVELRELVLGETSRGMTQSPQVTTPEPTS